MSTNISPSISLFQKKQKLEFCLVLLVALEGWYGDWRPHIWLVGYLAARKNHARVGIPEKSIKNVAQTR